MMRCHCCGFSDAGSVARYRVSPLPCWKLSVWAEVNTPRKVSAALLIVCRSSASAFSASFAPVSRCGPGRPAVPHRLGQALGP